MLYVMRALGAELLQITRMSNSMELIVKEEIAGTTTLDLLCAQIKAAVEKIPVNTIARLLLYGLDVK